MRRFHIKTPGFLASLEKQIICNYGPHSQLATQNFMNRYRVWGSLHVSLPAIQTHPLSSPSRHGIFQIIDARHSFALGHSASSETVTTAHHVYTEPQTQVPLLTVTAEQMALFCIQPTHFPVHLPTVFISLELSSPSDEINAGHSATLGTHLNCYFQDPQTSFCDDYLTSLPYNFELCTRQTVC